MFRRGCGLTVQMVRVRGGGDQRVAQRRGVRARAAPRARHPAQVGHRRAQAAARAAAADHERLYDRADLIIYNI